MPLGYDKSHSMSFLRCSYLPIGIILPAKITKYDLIYFLVLDEDEVN